MIELARWRAQNTAARTVRPRGRGPSLPGRYVWGPGGDRQYLPACSRRQIALQRGVVDKSGQNHKECGHDQGCDLPALHATKRVRLTRPPVICMGRFDCHDPSPLSHSVSYWSVSSVEPNCFDPGDVGRGRAPETHACRGGSKRINRYRSC